MFQVRFHGRGGQGVVTAAELLSIAAFLEGRYAHAVPSFGSERTGAPVVSYCRISDRPIRTREPVAEPDALIIQDSTLLNQVPLLSGFQPDGYVLLNTSHTFEDLGLDEFVASHRPERLVTVPASGIALELLGRPIVNAALLGGFAALTGMLSLDSVTAAIRRHFPPNVADGNAAAAAKVFERVELNQGDRAGA